MVKEHGKPYVIVFQPKDVCVEFNSGWGSRSYWKKELNLMLQAIWKGEILSSSISFCWKLPKIKES
jgi:hypothetical protein